MKNEMKQASIPYASNQVKEEHMAGYMVRNEKLSNLMKYA